MLKEIFTRIQHKYDTEENWENSSLVPLAGELITYEGENPKFKIGNGEAAVNDLPFVSDEVATKALNEYIESNNEVVADVKAAVLAVDEKAQSVLDMANNGEFKGETGANGYGVIGMDVINGELYITTEGVDDVNFVINNNGDLIYNFS